jgi:membrane protease YdiL (CAAX protease family)
MMISAIAPFLFLSKYGRKQIEIIKPKKYSWLFRSFILGLMFSVLLYFVGNLMYGNTFENWYVYIGKSYNIPIEIEPNDKLIMFVIMAITGMIFSPIGEELFFRGIVHSSFAKSFGNVKASIIDSFAFALTHISHFGLVFINNEWELLTFPTCIWTLSMFLVSILFYLCRKKSGSILGAIICHSAFNLGMIYCIFYLLNKT